MAGTVSSERIVPVDVARALGLFLVYHGHIVERMMYLGQEAAADQYKFIYAFHMPLFFVLAGWIAKDYSASMGLGRFLWSRLTSRVVPLLMFNLLLALTSLIFPRDFPPIPLASPADYGNAVLMSFTWLTVFNVPTWFLMCLTTVEIVHFALFRFLRSSNVAILVMVAICFAVGVVLNRSFDFFPGRNWWFWNEAPMAYAFYLTGVLLRRVHFIERPSAWWPWFLAACVAVAIVYLTYDLNQGPFRLEIDAVVILASAYGNPFWFAISAVAGIAGIIALAKLCDRSTPWLSYVGSQALIVFALNGLFYHHVNGPMAAWYVEAMPQDGWTLAAFAGIASVMSIVMTLPLVSLLNKWLPQLVGKPAQAGPLLPRLIRR